MALPLVMGIGDLDPYCAKLSTFFTLERETYRFNELKRRLKGMGMEMTTPTLVKHLNHLVEKEVIVRDEKKKQFVTYRFNWEKWQDADKHMKERILFEKMLKQEMDVFSARPIIQQVSYVNLTAVTMFHLALRELIVAKVKPEKQFMANINSIHFSNILNQNMDMILNNVEKKGEKYATECILTIDRLLKHYSEGMQETRKDFEKGEIPTIDITEKTNELLKKITDQLNENKEQEKWVLKSDVIGIALEEYAKKLDT